MTTVPENNLSSCIKPTSTVADKCEVVLSPISSLTQGESGQSCLCKETIGTVPLKLELLMLVIEKSSLGKNLTVSELAQLSNCGNPE